MYGDLLLDWRRVKFLGPAPLDIELLHVLTSQARHIGGPGMGCKMTPREGQNQSGYP